MGYRSRSSSYDPKLTLGYGPSLTGETARPLGPRAVSTVRSCCVVDFYLKYVLPLGENYEYHLVSSLYGQVAKLIEYFIEKRSSSAKFHQFPSRGGSSVV